VQGSALAGVGVAGATLTDTASTLSYSLGEMGPILQMVFVGMTMVGAGLTIYSAIKGARDE
jgi:hypothetical protein